VALFQRVFAHPMSEAHWRWKLASPLHDHTGVPTVFLAVGPDATGVERPLFQSAAIPIRFRGPGGDVTGLVAVDAMTDPAFRRQGLMSAVNRHAYDRWRDAGLPFVIGLPNEQWGARAAVLGWRELCSLVWRVRRIGPMAQFFQRALEPGADVRVRQVADAEAAAAAAVFDALWPRLAEARAPDSYTVVRDRRWIEWRYLASPDIRYRVWLAERHGAPAGYAVSRLRDDRRGRIGLIAEFGAADHDPIVERSLLASVVRDFRTERASQVAALAVPGSRADAALLNAGFRTSWGAFSVQMVPLRVDEPVTFCHVSGGDFDVV
jgi:hypothetical protein